MSFNLYPFFFLILSSSHLYLTTFISVLLLVWLTKHVSGIISLLQRRYDIKSILNSYVVSSDATSYINTMT